MKKPCARRACVTTIFGRKCHLPRIGSANASERAFFERAGDQCAEFRAQRRTSSGARWCAWTRRCSTAGFSAQMLLQVHDELVFEAPEAETVRTIEVVKRVMVEAPRPAMELSPRR